MTRTCSDCPAEISARSSGRCRSCGMRAVTQRPGYSARVSAGMRRAWSDPEKRANFRPGENLRRWCETPEGKAKLREMGQALPAHVTAEGRRRAGETLSKARLGWLPQEWRTRYFSLRAYHGATEAKARVLAEIADAQQERVASLTPFERTLLRVSQGAPVVMKPRMPSRSYDFTLGGVSAGLGL